MKRLFSFIVLAAFMMLLAVGCSTPTTVFEFDKAGKITKKTVTEKDAISKITESTKNKTIIAFSDGWVAYIQATIATVENPTPTGKMFAGKVMKCYMSILPDQQNIENIASIIQAMKSNLEVTGSGINNNTETTAETQKETTAAADVKD